MGLLINLKVCNDQYLGGIQEESARFECSLFNLRDNTEWMYYIEIGKNMLIGTHYDKILKLLTAF